ncbi:HIT family protein [Pseudoxanthomonas wuyuanensis]
MACPFCAILAGLAPASMVAESQRAVAFLDLRQAVPGHVLVVPRTHIGTVYELEAEVAAEVMQLAVRVARALRAALDPPGLNLWQSNGEAGGQEVPHFHLHVQPRCPHDGLLRIYPHGAPAPADAASLQQLAERLRPHLRAGAPAILPEF